MKIEKSRFEELVKAEETLDALFNAYNVLSDYDMKIFLKGVFGEIKQEGENAE